jgi:two-component system, LuxR family, response regulator FixJ
MVDVPCRSLERQGIKAQPCLSSECTILARIPIIAIIDDDPIVREALIGLLEVMAYKGLAFDGPQAFLTALAPGAFDCVVSDIRMPGMDGLEMQRHLQALQPELPFIFVTSVDEECVVRTALAQGARAVLPKPVDADELEAALSAI